MNPIITEHQTQIADLCRSHGVRRLEAYEPGGHLIDPPEGPFGAAFAIEFIQDARGFDQLRKLVNLEADLGKVLDCRVHVSQISTLKRNTDSNSCRRILREMEHVYGGEAEAAA